MRRSCWLCLGKTDKLRKSPAFINLANLIAIEVSQTHKTGSDFCHEHLSESGDFNNDVSSATSGNGDNSALVSEVHQVRELAVAIMQGTLTMRPFPVSLSFSTHLRFDSYSRLGNHYASACAWRPKKWISWYVCQSKFQRVRDPPGYSSGSWLCVVSLISCHVMVMGHRSSSSYWS